MRPVVVAEALEPGQLDVQGALAAAAMMCFPLLAGPAQAQTPPRRNPGICTVKLESVSGGIFVDGYGDHATPGRMKLILSSTNSTATRSSFNISLGFLETRSDVRAGAEFTDWEWRTAGQNRGTWQNALGGRNSIGFADGVLGENIIEVRPKAGAYIWSNRNASNPMAGPGQLVVPVIAPPRNTSQWTETGSAYFLFTGGEGCARVNEWGETDGTTQ